MQPDRLAKRLYQSIPERIGAATRRGFGCIDFLNDGYPDTTDPVCMALAWFQHVALDADQRFRDCAWAVETCITFLEAQTDTVPGLSDLQGLKDLLSKTPAVDLDDLAKWFNRVYPQERGRAI